LIAPGIGACAELNPSSQPAAAPAVPKYHCLCRDLRIQSAHCPFDKVASKRVEVEMNIEDAFEFATRVVDDANIAKQMGREEAHKAKAAVRR